MAHNVRICDIRRIVLKKSVDFKYFEFTFLCCRCANATLEYLYISTRTHFFVGS